MLIRVTKCNQLKRLGIPALAIVACLVVAGCSSRAEKAQNYYQHGMEYLKQKNFAKARIEFRNALQLKSDQVDAWRGLAEVDEHDQNLQGLVQDLGRVTELDDKDASARLRLARLLSMGGAPRRALKLVNEAANLSPAGRERVRVESGNPFPAQQYGRRDTTSQKGARDRAT